MKKLARTLTTIVTLLGISLIGCAAKTAKDDSSPTSEGDNADSNESTASESQASRMDHMIFGSIGSQDPSAAAGNVATAQWWPAGCATRTHDASNPNQVDIHLEDCTGPFGIQHHTGDIVVTFSKSADGSLHAEGHSSNMTINGKPVTWNSQADITVDTTAKTVTINFKGEWNRQSAKGEPVEHQRQGTTVIDVAAKCRDTNATATTHAASREVDSTIKDYKVCRKADGTDGCPTGEVDHTFKLSGKTVTVTFDGSAEAKITGPNGNSVEVPLVCTP